MTSKKLAKDTIVKFTIVFINLLLFSILFFRSLNHNLVFSGDSIQYLGMAHEIIQGRFPFSDKWMPFYPFLIAIFSVFTGGNLLHSVVIVNYGFLIGVILIVNYLFCKVLKLNALHFLFLNIILLFSREIYFNSLTIMAELPMLFMFLTSISYFIIKLKQDKLTDTKSLLFNAFLSILTLFTKYNGIVLLILFSFYIILLLAKEGKKIFIVFYYIAPILFFYILWTINKPGKEMFSNFLHGKEIYQNVLISGSDLFISFFDYFTIPKISREYAGLDKFFSLIFLVLLFLFMIFKVYNGLILQKELKRIQTFFFSFFLVYFSLLLFGVSFSGINEVNQRTMFYPFFTLSLFPIIILAEQRNVKLSINKAIKIASYTTILIFCLAGYFKVKQTYLKFRNEGYGELSKSYNVPYTSDALTSALSFIKRNNTNEVNLYSNKQKIVSIYLNYKELNPLPTNRQYLGNYFTFLDSSTISEIVNGPIKNDILNRKGLIVYLGSNSDSIYYKFYNFIDSNITHEFHKDGFLVYKKGF